MQDFYRRDQTRFLQGRLRVLNLLAGSAAMNFIYARPTAADRDRWRQKALEYIGRADKIESDNEATWLSKALFWMGEARREIEALRNAAYYADLAINASGICT